MGWGGSSSGGLQVIVFWQLRELIQGLIPDRGIQSGLAREGVRSSSM